MKIRLYLLLVVIILVVTNMITAISLIHTRNKINRLPSIQDIGGNRGLS